MHRFVYVSHAAEGTKFEVLGNISAESKARNLRDDLTGLLLWTEGAFIQLLEGPKLELDATISRIERDPRHSGLIRIAYGEISRRTCADWALGCFPMPTSGFRPAFLNASNTASIVQRFNATPGAELNTFFTTFYLNRVDRHSVGDPVKVTAQA